VKNAEADVFGRPPTEQWRQVVLERHASDGDKGVD
jgi:hypothetical protein